MLCCLVIELHLQTLLDRSLQLINGGIVMIFYSVKHKSIQIGLGCLRCMQSHFFIVGETKVRLRLNNSLALGREG
jgi:hypothetical protein